MNIFQNKSTTGIACMYCSFCGKSQHEIRKLIAGPNVLICNECVETCNEILREEGMKPAELKRPSLSAALKALATVQRFGKNNKAPDKSRASLPTG